MLSERRDHFLAAPATAIDGMSYASRVDQNIMNFECDVDTRAMSNANCPPADILESLCTQTRQSFERCAVERRFSRGEVLFQQGRIHTSTFFIRTGLVKTFYHSPEGREMTMAHWSRGSMVGGPEFFDTCPHVWSAVAIANTIALEISGAELERLFHQHRDLTEYIVHGLAFKVHWLSVMLQIMGTESVTDRIAHLLLQLARLYGSETAEGVALGYPFSQEDLANMVGSSRQWVNRTLCRFQSAGLISMQGRRLTLLNPAALGESKVLGSINNEQPARQE